MRTRSARSKARYIYIASRGHSGSTLLELVLGGHKELAPAGELEKLSLQLARDTFPYPGMCSCGRRPYECERWRGVIDAVRRERGVDIVRDPFSFRVSDVGKEEDYGRRAISHWVLNASTRAARYMAYSGAGELLRLPDGLWFAKRWVRNRLLVAETIRELAGASGVIDNSKDPLGMRDVATYGPDGVRILFLTRDPRASVYSTLRLGKGNVERAAEDWVDVNGTIIRLLAGVPQDRWMHLKYEDLCGDARTVCERLCAFLGYPYDAGMLDLTRDDHHTIGGNKIRFQPLGQIAEDLAWKQHLSASDLRAVDRVAGAMARTLGYDIARAS